MRKFMCLLVMLCLVCQPIAVLAEEEKTYHVLIDELYYGMPIEDFQKWMLEETTEQEEGVTAVSTDYTDISNFGVYEFAGLHLVLINARFDKEGKLVEYYFSLSEGSLVDINQYADKTRRQALEDCFAAFSEFTYLLQSIYGPVSGNAYTLGDFRVFEGEKTWPRSQKEFDAFLRGTQEETLWMRFDNVVCAIYKFPLSDPEGPGTPVMGLTNMIYYYGPESSEDGYAMFK